jgi:outer membrane protein insertion porin family
MKRMTKLALAVATVAAAMALACTAFAQGIAIKNIQIVGLKNLKESDVLSVLTIKPGDLVSTSSLTVLEKNADLLNDTGLFAERPKLSYEGFADGAILIVEVKENPLFKRIDITGNTLFTTDALSAKVTQKPGEVINLKKMEDDLVKGVLGVYHDAGYIGAYIIDFNVGSEGENEGVVSVKIGEGTIDEVVWEGNTRTKDHVIKREIRRLKPGQVLSRQDLEADLQRLYNTGLFEEVTPKFEPSLKEGYVKVIISVKESKTGQAGFGVGYSTINGVQGSLSFREKNLFGEGKSIGASVIISRNAPGFSFDYTDPNWRDKNFSFTTQIFNYDTLQQRNPGSIKESELNVNSRGGAISVGHQFAEHFTGTLSLNVTKYSYAIIKGDPFIGFSPIQRARLEQQGEARSISATGAWDTRDNIFSAHKGRLLQVTGEVAGFGGDFDFRKGIAESRYFLPIGRSTLAFREMVGVGSGTIPLFEQFLLGGVNSIRGLPEDDLAGSNAVLLNNEFRFPIGAKEQFGGVVFLDAGWAGETFSKMKNGKGAGLGFRFKIPALGLGAIRIDWGYDISTGKIRPHFGIGEMF